MKPCKIMSVVIFFMISFFGDMFASASGSGVSGVLNLANKPQKLNVLNSPRAATYNRSNPVAFNLSSRTRVNQVYVNPSNINKIKFPIRVAGQGQVVAQRLQPLKSGGASVNDSVSTVEIYEPHAQDDVFMQKSPLRVTPLVQETPSVAKAKNVYARMGTSFQAVVDAFSRMTLGTIQKIMNYLKGVENIDSAVVKNLGDSQMPPDQKAEALAQLPPRVAEGVVEIAMQGKVEIVQQASEFQAESGEPYEQLLAQAGVERKSGSIKMPVQKFVALDPGVQESSKPFVALDQKNVLGVSRQVGSETLPVEDVQQQQKDVIQKDFKSGMLLQEQLKFAQKQKQELERFAQKQSEKGKSSDASNAVKALKERIKLLKEQIQEEKIVSKEMKDEADVLPDMGKVLGKKSQEQIQARNPMKSVEFGKISGSTKPVNGLEFTYENPMNSIQSIKQEDKSFVVPNLDLPNVKTDQAARPSLDLYVKKMKYTPTPGNYNIYPEGYSNRGEVDQRPKRLLELPNLFLKTSNVQDILFQKRRNIKKSVDSKATVDAPAMPEHDISLDVLYEKP